MFSRLRRFWTEGAGPISGRRRALFYGGLWVLAWVHWKSPLRGIDLYEQTHPLLFRSYGVLGALGVGYVDPVVVRVVTYVTAASWLCAALGLWTRRSMIVTGLGAAFLHGLYTQTNVYNHAWFLPMWALVAMMFVRPGPEWSLDERIRAKRKAGEPLAKAASTSGLPRMVLWLLVVSFYFGAGVCKWQVSGFDWLDGHTVAYFLDERSVHRPWSAGLVDQAFLCQALAIITLLVETLAPLAFFVRRLRWPFMIGWSLMHLGIWGLIGPWYWANIWVLWSLLAERADLRPAQKPGRRLAVSRSMRGPVGATALAGLLLAVVLGQVFYWPLSNVYMYSSHYSLTDDIRAGRPLRDYQTVEGLTQMAEQFADERPPIDEMEFFPTVFFVQLRTADGATQVIDWRTGAASEKQWRLTVLLPAAVEGLSGRSDPTVIRSWPERSMWSDIVQLVHKEVLGAGRFESIQLVARLAHGGLVVLSDPLPRPPHPK